MVSIPFTTNPFGLIPTSSGRIDGLSRGQTRRLLRDHLVERVHPNVLRVAAFDRSYEQRVAAAAMAVEGVASHGSVLRIHEARGWGSFDEVHVSIEARRCISLAGAVVHRRKAIDGHIRQWNGMAMTSPALALIDAGFDAPPLRLRSAFHDLWHRGLVTPDELESTIAAVAASGRLGVPQARHLLERYRPGVNPARSLNEIRLYDAIHDAGLPLPILNHPVVRPNGVDAFLDLAWPEYGYCIEIDHSFTHTPDTAVDDLRRHGDLTLLGWFVDRPMEEHLEGRGVLDWVEIARRRLVQLGRRSA